MEYVYPKIKEYCREKHGLEYQVVDMRWGVRDEMTDEHMTTVSKSQDSRPIIVPPILGSLHERASRVPEIQYGTQFHLLRSSKVKVSCCGFSFFFYFSKSCNGPVESPIRCNVTSLGGWVSTIVGKRRETKKSFGFLCIIGDVT